MVVHDTRVRAVDPAYQNHVARCQITWADLDPDRVSLKLGVNGAPPMKLPSAAQMRHDGG